MGRLINKFGGLSRLCSEGLSVTETNVTITPIDQVKMSRGLVYHLSPFKFLTNPGCRETHLICLTKIGILFQSTKSFLNFFVGPAPHSELVLRSIERFFQFT